jgi:serine/threonine protein kinase
MATIHQRNDQSSGSGIFQNLPRISGFTVLEHLHEGSHSAIYRARQDRLGRVVALKLLPEWPPPTDVALERFNRAAYVAAQAPHPNLLTLFDTGARDGFYYASIEFVAGQTLQRQLAQVPQTDERVAMQVGLQVARALAALNAKDICHRNVKPKNIFVETTGNVRLIGLGLASCKSAFFSPHLDSHAIGTPHFMAPEMIRGCCADPRSDLYSLGVTLFLMTAGRPPFDSGIPAAVMTRHLTETPRSLAQLRPDLSKPFINLVHMLISREPDQRLQSARDVVAVLEPLLKVSDVSNPQPKPSPVLAVHEIPGKKRMALKRAMSHPIAISVISALATVIALLAMGKAFSMIFGEHASNDPAVETVAPKEQALKPIEAAPAPPAADAPDQITSEKQVVMRLLEREEEFRKTPAKGKVAWVDFLNAFPNADAGSRKIAQDRLSRYLELETLERLRREPAQAEPPKANTLPEANMEF